MKKTISSMLLFFLVFTLSFLGVRDEVRLAPPRVVAQDTVVVGVSRPPMLERLAAALKEFVNSAYVEQVLSDPRFGVDSGTARILKAPVGRKDDYRWLFTLRSVGRGKEFLVANRALLEDMEKRYRVTPHLATAVLKAETDLGDSLGRHLVVNTLYTIYAVSAPRRASALQDLRCFLALSQEREWDPLAVQGSWAGAFGIPQFMPCSYAAYAVDGNGDGLADLFDLQDALFSMGNFLASHGLRANGENQLAALRAYNGSAYARAIAEYASRVAQ